MPSLSITLIVMAPIGEMEVGVIVNTNPDVASPVIEKYVGIVLPKPSVVWIETAFTKLIVGRLYITVGPWLAT